MKCFIKVSWTNDKYAGDKYAGLVRSGYGFSAMMGFLGACVELWRWWHADSKNTWNNCLIFSRRSDGD